ncbi:type III restriction endonuclease subunit M [Shouchella clausii]|uniref:Type III restriction endonuclease subunit M n=1 Tax=Shouchella clausii TaxID=79880 RepID=A0A268RU54_SHOCL|nr:type III restriction endonuclease subunit M [Shouchella clausii]
MLKAFISNETLKSNFTIDIAENIVMQTNKLIELFEADEYWKDSYTKYSKRIGLTAGGKFIGESTDVVLDFPYKDTVLKASMSKEDTDKDDLRPHEPFLNEVIAKEEIDVLLDKKILVNAKKYDENGEHEVDSFSEDDNLIIKGNNLLALHTLKEKYAGKVKLIYIDPPFNTSGDSFLYNDRFNHSTWLIFMKNRLEIAKDLLATDGTIYIHLDYNEVHYLKVLMDEIFGRENFLNEIVWAYRERETSKRFYNRKHDTILFYAKDINSKYTFNHDAIREQYSDITIKKFKYTDENGRKYRLRTKDGKSDPAVEDENTYRQYLDEQSGPLPRDWFVMPFLNQAADERVGFNTQKPELLVAKFIKASTNKNDIILDFFSGSGTTVATAHKLNRRYIGIEQMDYINTVSVPRLQRVIEGEQSGISEDVNWQGGGSVVYVELMEKNRGFLTSIRNAETQAELHDVFKFMLEEAEIDFRVDLEKIKDTLHELSFDDQKKTLIKIIDKNQLYYNYSEIDDKNVRDLISDGDYAFNKNFYGEGGK